jgi:hypothetical protein
LFEDRAALGVRPVEEEPVIEPEQVEGPERQGNIARSIPGAGESGEESVEVAGGPGAGYELPVEDGSHADSS